MAVQQSNEIEDLRKALADEIDATAKFVAQNLEGGVAMSDVIAVPHSVALDYVRKGWQDPQFRQDLLARLGPTQFWDIAHEAHGMKPPKVTAATLGQDPMANLDQATNPLADAIRQPEAASGTPPGAPAWTPSMLESMNAPH